MELREKPEATLAAENEQILKEESQVVAENVNMESVEPQKAPAAEEVTAEEPAVEEASAEAPAAEEATAEEPADEEASAEAPAA